MREELGKKISRGLAWSSLESFGGAAITLATTMVLARLISPEEYGLIAILQIFISVALLLVESGFSTALIRLKQPTEKDESTAFAFNLTISLLIYGVIFLAAPFIASFYGNEELTGISRIYALVIPLNALCIVQHARLTSSMRFGALLSATGIATVLSSVVAIILAWMGRGVQALVVQQLCLWGIRGIILWWIQRKFLIIPRFHSRELKNLFGFGWKLLLSSLIAKVSGSIYTMTIGKVFTVTEAGLFFKANTLAAFPAENGTAALQRVSFPALCKIESEREKMAFTVRQLLGMSEWVMLPVMFLLASLSPQAIYIFLGKGWMEAAPFFSFICIGFAFYPINSINLNVLNVAGRSDLFLRLEIIKALLSIVFMIVGLILAGMIGICAAFALFVLMCIPINGFYSAKFCSVSIRNQIALISGPFLLASVSSCGAYLIAHIFSSPFVGFFVGASAAGIIYMLASFMFYPSYIFTFRKAVRHIIRRK